MSIHSRNNDTTAEQGSVVEAAEGLIAAIRAYERGRGTPPLTLLGDREIEEFFGCLPTLSASEFERLETLVQMERDRRDSEHDDDLEARFAFAEVA